MAEYELSAVLSGRDDLSPVIERAEDSIHDARLAVESLDGSTATVTVDSDISDALTGLDTVDTRMDDLDGSDATAIAKLDISDFLSGAETVEAKMRDIDGSILTVGIELNTAEFARDLSGVENRLGASDGRGATLSVDLDISGFLRKAQQVENRFDSLADLAGDLSLGLDISEFQQKARKVEDRFGQLDALDAEASIGLDAKRFYDNGRRVIQRVEEIGALSAEPTVGLDTDDFAAAATQVTSTVSALSELGVSVGADMDTAGLAADAAKANTIISSIDGREIEVSTDVDFAPMQLGLAAISGSLADTDVQANNVTSSFGKFGDQIQDFDGRFSKAFPSAMGDFEAAMERFESISTVVATVRLPALAQGIAALSGVAVAGVGGIVGLATAISEGLVGALGAGVGAAGGLAASLGLLIAPITMLTGNLTKYGQAQQQAATQAAQMQNAQDALATANDRVGETIQGVADAQTQASQANQESYAAWQESIEAVSEAEQSAAETSNEAYSTWQENIEGVSDAVQEASEQSQQAYEAWQESVQGISEARDSAAQGNADSLEQVREAQQETTDTIESTNRQLQESWQGVIDQREGVAESIQDGNARIEDAEEGLADAREQVVDATERFRDTQEELNDALRDEPLTQREAALDLADARDRASDAQVDLNEAISEYGKGSDEAEDAARSLERAQINLIRTERESQDTRKEGSDQLQSALESNRQAYEGVNDSLTNTRDQEENLRDTRKEAYSAVEDQREAARKAERDYGQQVEDAQEQIADSRQRETDTYQDYLRTRREGAQEVRDAQEQASDQYEAYVKTQQQGEERVAGAQEQAREAYSDYVQSRRDGEEQVQEAREAAQDQYENYVQTQQDGEQRIAEAQEQVAAAQQAAEKAARALQAQQEQTRKKTIQLTAAQQGLYDELQRYRLLGRDAFTPAADELARLTTDVLQTSEVALPALGATSLRVARGVNAAWRDVKPEFFDSDQQDRFTSFLEQIPEQTELATSGIIDFGLGTINVLDGLLPSGTKLLTKFDGLGESFRNWSRSARGQNAIAKFMDDALETTEDLGMVLGDLVVGFYQLGGAAKAAGLDTTMVRGLQILARGFREATTRGTDTRRMIVKVGRDSKPILKAVGRAVFDIGREFFKTAAFVLTFTQKGKDVTVLEQIINSFGKVAVPIFSALRINFRRLGPVLGDVLVEFGKFVETFGPAEPILATFLSEGLLPMMRLFNNLPLGMQRTIGRVIGLTYAANALTGGGGGRSGLIGLTFQLGAGAYQMSLLRRIAANTGPALGGAGAGASVFARGMRGARSVGSGLLGILLGPAGLVVALSALAIGGFFLAYNRSETFRKGVDNLGTSLIGSKNIAKITKDGWKGLGDVASDNTGLSILWAQNLNEVRDSMTGVKDTRFNRALLDIAEGLRGVKNESKETDTAAFDFGETLRALSGQDGGILGKLNRDLRDDEGLSGAFKKLASSADSSSTDTVDSWRSAQFQLVGNSIIPDMVRDILSWIEDMTTGLWERGRDIYDALTEPFRQAKNDNVDNSIVPDMADAIESVLSGMGLRVRRALGDVPQAMKAPFEEAGKEATAAVERAGSLDLKSMSGKQVRGQRIKLPGAPQRPNLGPDLKGTFSGLGTDVSSETDKMGLQVDKSLARLGESGSKRLKRYAEDGKKHVRGLRKDVETIHDQITGVVDKATGKTKDSGLQNLLKLARGGKDRTKELRRNVERETKGLEKNGVRNLQRLQRGGTDELDTLGKKGTKEVKDFGRRSGREFAELDKRGRSELRSLSKGGVDEVQSLAKKARPEFRDLSQDGKRQLESLNRGGARSTKDLREDGAANISGLKRRGAADIKDLKKVGSSEIVNLRQSGVKNLTDLNQKGSDQTRALNKSANNNTSNMREFSGQKMFDLKDSGVKNFKDLNVGGTNESNFLKQNTNDSTQKMREFSGQKMFDLKDSGVRNFKDLKTGGSDESNRLKQNANDSTQKMREFSGQKMFDLKDSGIRNFTDLQTRGSDQSQDLKRNASDRSAEMRKNVGQSVFDMKEAGIKNTGEFRDKGGAAMESAGIRMSEPVDKSRRDSTKYMNDMLEAMNKFIDETGVDTKKANMIGGSSGSGPGKGPGERGGGDGGRLGPEGGQSTGPQGLPIGRMAEGGIIDEAGIAYMAKGGVGESIGEIIRDAVWQGPEGGMSDGVKPRVVYGEKASKTGRRAKEAYIREDGPVYDQIGYITEAARWFGLKVGADAQKPHAHLPEQAAEKAFRDQSLMHMAEGGLFMGVPNGYILYDYQEYVPNYPYSADSRHKGVDVWSNNPGSFEVQSNSAGRVQGNPDWSVGSATAYDAERKGGGTRGLVAGHIGNPLPVGSSFGPGDSLGSVVQFIQPGNFHVHWQAYQDSIGAANYTQVEPPLMDPKQALKDVGGSIGVPVKGSPGGGGGGPDYVAMLEKEMPKKPKWPKHIVGSATDEMTEALRTQMVEKVGGKANSQLSGSSGSGTGKITPFKGDWASAKGGGPDENRGIAQAASKEVGWENQWSAWEELITRESGFDRMAKNSSSGAYGLPQALPESKLPPAGQSSGGSNAGPQLAWMIDYIKGRYTDPNGAITAHNAQGWYSSGGITQKPHVGVLGEKGPEMFIPLDDKRAVSTFLRRMKEAINSEEEEKEHRRGEPTWRSQRQWKETSQNQTSNVFSEAMESQTSRNVVRQEKRIEQGTNQSENSTGSPDVEKLLDRIEKAMARNVRLDASDIRTLVEGMVQATLNAQGSPAGKEIQHGNRQESMLKFVQRKT